MTSKNKECEYCGEEIKPSDKCVLLATITPKAKPNKVESYFHFECFKKNHNEKVNRKARAIIMQMQKQATGLFEQLGGMVGNMQGLGNIGSMLGIDLSKEIPNMNQDLSKYQDDKPKKSKKGKRQ